MSRSLPPVGARVRHSMSRGLGVVVAHVDDQHVIVRRADGVEYQSHVINWWEIKLHDPSPCEGPSCASGPSDCWTVGRCCAVSADADPDGCRCVERPCSCACHEIDG